MKPEPYGCDAPHDEGPPPLPANPWLVNALIRSAGITLGIWCMTQDAGFLNFMGALLIFMGAFSIQFRAWLDSNR